MRRSPLRQRKPGKHAQVTSLELFFDLVFVFAITQVSHSLLHHLTWAGALEAAFLLLAVWWAWVFTAWVTNWIDPDHPAVRVALFALMAVGLVLSTSLSNAFDQRALVFAGAYVTFQVGRTAFMLWAGREDPVIVRNFQRILVWLVTSGVFWIAGGLLPGVRPALWAIALVIEYVGPSAGFWSPGFGRTATQEWTVEGGHLAERCGLFVMICLGESILVTGATFADKPWTVAELLAFASALLGSIAMWWIYFSSHADAASHRIEKADDPGAVARIAYTYMHIPIIAGIVVSAAGDELALSHPTGHAGPVTAAILIGGPALYLAGALAFKFSVFRVISPSRASGLLGLALLAPFAMAMTPLTITALTTAVLIGVGAWESLRNRAEAHVAA